MKLIMTLLVRDEEDIIRANILYHLDRGVDFIIATDNNSRDSTPSILMDFQRQGCLHLISETDDDYSQSEWVTRMARMAATDFGADWIINSDADEFWWPLKMDLKNFFSEVPAECSIVEARRYDFIPRPEHEGSLFDRMVIKDLKPMNHIGLPLPPKVCHRALPNVIVGQGNHNLIMPADLKCFKSDALQILHFPIRTYPQFENKIILGGAAYERNTKLPKTVARGWRNLYEDYKQGLLPEYYNKKTLSQEEVNQGISENRYIIDTCLRDHLKTLDLSKGRTFV